MGNMKVTQLVVRSATEIGPPSQTAEKVALFNPDGSAYEAYGSATKVIPPKVVALTDAATVATDASSGTHFTLTLTGNHTLGAPTNPVDGQRITYEVKQDGTGSHTLAYSSSAGGFSFGAGSAPTVTATAGATSFIDFVYSSRVAKWCYKGSWLGF